MAEEKCDIEAAADDLRGISTLVPREILDDIKLERPDLPDLPVRLVPQGVMGAYDGWHHWNEQNGSVEVFVSHPQKELIKHELCHGKVLRQFGVDGYSKLTETQKEMLTELCRVGVRDRDGSNV